MNLLDPLSFILEAEKHDKFKPLSLFRLRPFDIRGERITDAII